VTVNAAVVAPPATVTVGGVTAKAESELSETVMPPERAGLLRVTVPVVVLPPSTLPGLSPILDSAGVFTVILADLVLVPHVAAIVATESWATGDVVIGYVAVVAPCATVTLAGTVAKLESETSVTFRPPLLWAGVLSVTVPVARPTPPNTEFGSIVSEISSCVP
jgi:hypothetical protein